jgi:hypothetical protein
VAFSLRLMIVGNSGETIVARLLESRLGTIPVGTAVDFGTARVTHR